MGGVDNTEPPTPLVEFDQQVTISRVWEKDVGDGYDKQYLKLNPIHSNDRIFVAESSGDVLAIDRTSGKQLWSTDTDSDITGGPGAGNNLVSVGTGKAEVITLSADSGEILWRTRVTSEVLAAPQVAGEYILVRTIDGKIFGLNAADGNRMWVYERSVPALTLRGTSAPVVSGDYVITGFDDGRLVAIELQTGKPVWEARVALGSGRSELERMVDINAEPIIVDDIIYVATFQGRVAALDLLTGRILWTRDISSYAGLCVDKNAVYVTDDDSAIWALDRLTGVSIWKQDKLHARAVTAPESIGEMVVVGDLEGYLHWMNKSTGEFVARNQISSKKIIAPPVAVENILFSYASDGTLGAYMPDRITGLYSNTTAATVTGDQEETADTVTEDEESGSGESEADVETDATETAETTEDPEEEESFLGRMMDRMFSD